MFKKIDCVMVRVDDVASAEKFYADVFGLKPRWREAGAVGMRMPDTDAEIVLHSSADIPHKVEVHYLVENVIEAVKSYAEKGCRVLVPPFEVLIGKCAVIEDPFGTVICLLDLTSGRHPTYIE
jgi:predicted enzyme related to lactoylglutathione lyase